MITKFIGMKTTFILVIFFAFSLCNIHAQNQIPEFQQVYNFLEISQNDSALYIADELCARVRGNFGENSLEFAHTLNPLCAVYVAKGEYQKADFLIQKELKILENLKQINKNDYIHTLVNASITSRLCGKMELSLKLIQKAQKKAKGIIRLDSVFYADIQANIAAIYNDWGSAVSDLVILKKAEKYFFKSNTIYALQKEKHFEKYILGKYNYASWLNNTGNSAQAELIFLQLLEEISATGIKNPNYLSILLNNLGVLYYNKANYKKAEIYFLQSLENLKNTGTTSGLNLSIINSNLGSLYLMLGNYGISAQLFSQSKLLLEKQNLIKTRDYALIFNNLSMSILNREYYASPEKKNPDQLRKCGELLLTADTLFETNTMLPNPSATIIRLNLSVWYKMMNETKRALLISNLTTSQSGMGNINSMMPKMELSSELILNESQTSTLHPVLIAASIPYIESMKNDSAMLENSKNQELSTVILMRMIIGKGKRHQRVLGDYHPYNAAMLNSLADLYWSIGDYTYEQDLRLKSVGITNHNLMQNFSFLSENEKEMYIQTCLPQIYDFMEYCMSRKWRNPAIGAFAYNQVLQDKGLMLKSSTAMRFAILNSGDTDLIKKYDHWISLQKEISALYSTPTELRQKDVKQIENQANIIEKQLVESSQDFGNFRKNLQLKWTDIRKYLKSGEAAIEFTDYHIKGKDGINKIYYCALIVKSDSRYPEMIRLFQEKDLQSIIDNQKSSDILYVNNLYGTSSRWNEQLYQLIWRPLEKYLNGIHSVYISPSGLLNKISFPAISKEINTYLCDVYKIQMLGSTANFLNSSEFFSENQSSALILGGIKYGGENQSFAVWDFLPSTELEAKAVSSIFEQKQFNAVTYSGINATESFLKQQAPQFNILHIATHGFFFPDPNEIRNIDTLKTVESGPIAFRGSSKALGVSTFVNNLNPLMRSGLVMAGANEVWNQNSIVKSDDGVLTAQEVAQLDLRKNQLVVLSACETGLGDIQGSEGVYGMQRALKMAGVNFIINSLWQVPDKETEEFMVLFYTKMFETKSIKTGFQLAQQEMRKKYEPYYWAAFVLIE